MKILADENVPLPVVTPLRKASHQVEYVQRNVDDRIILEDAYRKQALLLTSDKDFERLVLEDHRPTWGVIQLRISRSIPFKDRAQILINVLRHRQRELQGAYVVLTESILDIRRPLP